MAHAQLAAIPDAGIGNVLPQEANAAAGGLFQTSQTKNQLALAVALDAGHADDLAPAHRKAHIPDGIFFMHAAGDNQMLYIQHSFSRHLRLFLHSKTDVMAHHQAGQFFLGGIGNVHRAHISALAQHGAAIRHRHDLVELVGDEQDALALFFEPAHDLHELFDLLRGQHGGRLIENQNIVVPVQHLEDLHALLHAHRNIADQCVRIHAQAVFFRERHHLFAGLRLLQKAVAGILHAKDDIVQHAEAFHQFKMLVDHADTQTVGIVGVAHADFLAIFFDHTLFRLVQTEQNAHQGGLTGAILAKQRMNLPPPKLERDVIVCFDAGEYLGDVQHFNDKIFCQWLHSLSLTNILIIQNFHPFYKRFG